MNKEFQLTGSIPIEIQSGNWLLVLTKPISDNTLYIPEVLFELPNSEVKETNQDLGTYYSFADSNGAYSIKLNSINRLPIEDQGILTAKLTIKNNGNTMLPIPVLTGTFQLEESIEREATLVMPDKQLGIPPSTSINVQAMCKLPYTFGESRLKLMIQEKDSGSSSNDSLLDVVEFTYTGDFNPIAYV